MEISVTKIYNFKKEEKKFKVQGIYTYLPKAKHKIKILLINISPHFYFRIYFGCRIPLYKKDLSLSLPLRLPKKKRKKKNNLSLSLSYTQKSDADENCRNPNRRNHCMISMESGPFIC